MRHAPTTQPTRCSASRVIGQLKRLPAGNAVAPNLTITAESFARFRTQIFGLSVSITPPGKGAIMPSASILHMETSTPATASAGAAAAALGEIVAELRALREFVQQRLGDAHKES